SGLGIGKVLIVLQVGRLRQAGDEFVGVGAELVHVGREYATLDAQGQRAETGNWRGDRRDRDRLGHVGGNVGVELCPASHKLRDVRLDARARDFQNSCVFGAIADQVQTTTGCFAHCELLNDLPVVGGRNHAAVD